MVFSFVVLYLCVCMCVSVMGIFGHTHAIAYMQKSEVNLWKSVLPSYQVGSRDGTKDKAQQQAPLSTEPNHRLSAWFSCMLSCIFFFFVAKHVTNYKCTV